MPSEDLKNYEELRKRIADAVKQNDIFEQFWIDDLTHQVWEAARYRAMMVALVQGTMQRGLQRLLAPMVDVAEGVEAMMIQSTEQLPSEKLARGYFASEGMAIEQVDELLKRAGLNWEAVQAETMALRGPEFQRINHLLAKAEARRAATLRALERHRTGLGAQLQAIAKEFDQAELNAADTEPVATKLAA